MRSILRKTQSSEGQLSGPIHSQHYTRRNKANYSISRDSRLHGISSESAELIARKKTDIRQTIRLLEAAAGRPSPAELRTLRSQIDSLSKLNPTPNPSESPKINGTWVLLYTAKLSEVSRGENLFQALSGSVYEQVYKYLPVLGGSAVGKQGARDPVRSRGNFQTFDLAAGTVINEARFEVPAFGQQGVICVDGLADVVPGIDGAPSCLKATFTSFSLSVGGEQRLKLPLTVLPSSAGAPFSLSGPVGYVYTSFLDDELRISTGDKGSVFIAIRKKEPS